MVDGLSADPLVVVEVYAHRGAMRGAQSRRVASDILKLATVQRLVYPRARLAIVLNDPVVAAQISGRWLGTAAHQWAVEIVVVDLPVDVNAGISTAQARQTRWRERRDRQGGDRRRRETHLCQERQLSEMTITSDEITALRDLYDTTDQSGTLKTAELDASTVDDPMVGITIRLPAATLNTARALAASRGIKVTALIRD